MLTCFYIPELNWTNTYIGRAGFGLGYFTC